ncbi:MAG TPA: peptidoglycan-binding protein [Limnochordia bacterium]|nr:peptidoglycan-binding protein [Limnochordia bacterium]
MHARALCLLALLWFAACGALAAAPVPGCETDRVLSWVQPPLSGLDVSELQSRLQTLGFYQGAVDGVFGPGTRNAVAQFQAGEGVPATGQVTDATWDLLAEGLAVPTVARLQPPSGEISLLVDANRLKLIVMADGKPYHTFPVAVGRGGTYLSTPVGNFKIINKDKGWGGGFGTRWLGLNVPEGIYGIHGTNKPWSIGSRASHGCIRMFNHDVEVLWEWVKVGTPVTIIGPPADVPHRDPMQPGMSGPDVRNVQLRLQEGGFDPTFGADGRYGEATVQAVTRLQRLYGLPADGTAYSDVQNLLFGR